MPRYRNILIPRFSAMGDVAMLAAVVRLAARQNPDVRFCVVTRKGFELFFTFGSGTENIAVRGVDLKDSRYKGVRGMWRLVSECVAQWHPDAMADMHLSLRTRLMSLFMSLRGRRVRHLDKQRSARRALTARQGKSTAPLRPMTECYADVLRRLGIEVALGDKVLVGPFASPFFDANVRPGHKAVGVAPFARHEGKIYPVGLMERTVAELSAAGADVFVFGGGAHEREVAERWSAAYDGVVSVIGRLDMAGEMALISNLDVMISMDSASQHIASLVSVPVVSVWGATHPRAGFYGYGQNPAHAVELDMECRPCSVFGNKPCYKGGYPCMGGIAPEAITRKALEFVR
ncbi:MAG: glycosyltransferase family 9 protein [Rikenellaceae bacterium]|nr:glycosyltransferase family 9 protein [Rikenellaceae bacterium]